MRKHLKGLLLLILSFGLCGVSVTAYAETKPELDARVAEAKKVLSEIMATPDRSIPEELLAKCKAIAVYPTVLKAGFIFGGRFGKGVVLRHNEATGQWGPVAFRRLPGGAGVFKSAPMRRIWCLS